MSIESRTNESKDSVDTAASVNNSKPSKRLTVSNVKKPITKKVPFNNSTNLRTNVTNKQTKQTNIKTPMITNGDHCDPVKISINKSAKVSASSKPKVTKSTIKNSSEKINVCIGDGKKPPKTLSRVTRTVTSQERVSLSTSETRKTAKSLTRTSASTLSSTGTISIGNSPSKNQTLVRKKVTEKSKKNLDSGQKAESGGGDGEEGERERVLTRLQARKQKRGSAPSTDAKSSPQPQLQKKEREAVDKRNRRLEYERQRVDRERRRTPEKDVSAGGGRRNSTEAELRKRLSNSNRVEVKKRVSEEKKEVVTRREQATKRTTESLEKEEVDRNSAKVIESIATLAEESSLNSKALEQRLSKTESPIVHHKMTTEDGRITTTSSTSAVADLERRERIQRYKEDRRKQLAVRYSSGNQSSSDEDNPSEVNPRRRRRHRNGLDSSSATDLSQNETRKSKENLNSNSTESRLVGRRTLTGSSSEDKIALGTGYRSVLGNSNNDNANEINANLKDRVSNSACIKNTYSDLVHQKSLTQDSGGDSTYSGSDGRKQRPAGIGGLERDKSHKRKSHLNRTTTSETAVYPILQTHLSDSSEDVPRRRRRRPNGIDTQPSFKSSLPETGFKVSGSELSPQQSPSDKIGTFVASTFLRSSNKINESNKTPSIVTSPLRAFSPPPALSPIKPAPGSRSAPSTLDARTKLTGLFDRSAGRNDEKLKVVQDAQAHQREPLIKESAFKKPYNKLSPLKISPLRKPEIPEVLRQKDSTNLSSPGVVVTPLNSRPSSVILEKPPSGSEAQTPRTPVLKGPSSVPKDSLSIRKSAEPGSISCFLSARREKREETKPVDFIREFKKEKNMVKNLPQSEGDFDVDVTSDISNANLESNETDTRERCDDDGLNNKIDNLTSQAKDMIRRAEVLSGAESVVTECQEFLTQNKESHLSSIKKSRSLPKSTKLIIDSGSPGSGSGSLHTREGVISDTGQKNGPGGPEASGEKIRRLVFEEKVREICASSDDERAVPCSFSSLSPVSSGPPHHTQSVHFHSDSDIVSEDNILGSILKRNRNEESSLSPPSLIASPNQESESSLTSILRRRSKDDLHSILKRKSSSSRASSVELLDDESPRPILKKRTSADDDSIHSLEPRPILKKKSSTDDDDLRDGERPRSILKGARSREDLDRELASSPTPILKRGSSSPFAESFESSNVSDLRPILKRRDTSVDIENDLQRADGEIFQRARSDSAPESVVNLRGRSPAPSTTPPHSILKKKRSSHSPGGGSDGGDLCSILKSPSPGSLSLENEVSLSMPPQRPISPSLSYLRSKREDSERPLSVAERIAGMEALDNVRFRDLSAPSSVVVSPVCSPVKSCLTVGGVKPKVRASSGERPRSPKTERNFRRNSWVASTDSNVYSDPDPLPRNMNSFLNEFSSQDDNGHSQYGRSSRVSEKAAFFAKLEQDKNIPAANPPPFQRKERGARFATQPVTLVEVHEASRSIEKPQLEISRTAAAERKSSMENRVPHSPPIHSPEQTVENQFGTRGSNENLVASNGFDESSILFPNQAVNLSLINRAPEVDEGSSHDNIRGILKSDFPRDIKQKESPRSILKSNSGSRKSSLTEIDQPKGILKSERLEASYEKFVEVEQKTSELKYVHSRESSSDSCLEGHHRTSTVVDESEQLRSVLKKDSSIDEVKESSKEIRSILKPESVRLDPEPSSDSSYELAPEPNSFSSLCAKDDLAEALRQIEPIRSKSRERDSRRSPFEAEAKSSTNIDRLRREQELSVKSVGQRTIRSESLEREMMRTGNKQTNWIHQQQIDNTESEDSYAVSRRSEGEVLRRGLSERVSSEERSRPTLGKVTVNFPKDEFTDEKKGSTTNLSDSSSSNGDSSSSASSSPVTSPTLSPFSPFSHPRPSEGEKPSVKQPSPPLARPPFDALRPLPRNRGSEMSAADLLSTSPIFARKHIPPIISPPEESSTDGGCLPKSASASSINARLSALQRNGEENWRQRLPKKNDSAQTNATAPAHSGIEEQTPKRRQTSSRPSSLLDRVSQLESSSHQWKGRVSESDAAKFTVAHRIASASTSSVPSLLVNSLGGSPIVPGVPSLVVTSTEYRESSSSSVTFGLQSPSTERRRRSPQPRVFKSKTGSCVPDVLAIGAELNKDRLFMRSQSSSEQKTETRVPEIISVPSMDAESFDAFFTSVQSSTDDVLPKDEYIDLDHFDHISLNSSKLVVRRHGVKAARKTQTRRNPLRALAKREDIKDEYTEFKLGAGERELRRMKVEELSKSSSFAMEALAGLASKENFSSVALRKVDLSTPVSREMRPHLDLMLIRIKGRRHAQARLVEPSANSINSGDDFLLITPEDVFHYKGQFSNVIERATASDMAAYIVQTKDMGSGATHVTEIEDGASRIKSEKFWRLLGSPASRSALPPSPPEEDDLFESALIASNKIFVVKDKSLIPVKEAWGQCPKYGMLDSHKVFVFDFGSEVYSWSGKRANPDERKTGLILAKELWQQDCADYSDCDINPIDFKLIQHGETTKVSRPSWGICGKITENVETILFKEKYIDWPDTAQQALIKESRHEAASHVAPVCPLEPCNVVEMQQNKPEEADLILEMSHLGRGLEYYDDQDTPPRLHCINTTEFKVWHICEGENSKSLISSTDSSGIVLHSGDTYVVRWFYYITTTGRTLKGAPSKHNVTGRYRVAYFFWQGEMSSVTDKGLSALMTVELDEERGPQIRVMMGHEPPAFLNLFNGSLVILKGRRDEASSSSSVKLFIVRGETESEAHLFEVDIDPRHFRSKGCLISMNNKSAIITLWIGSKANHKTRKIAKETANNLLRNCTTHFNLHATSVSFREEFEGCESKDFLSSFISGSKLSPSAKSFREKFYSLLNSTTVLSDCSPRVWHFEVTNSNSFEAREIVSSYRLKDSACPFPVWQDEIYSVQQPALFLIDSGSKVFIWQGCFPQSALSESSDSMEQGSTCDVDKDIIESSTAVTGSALLRFNFARRAALQTALNYVDIKKSSSSSSSVYECHLVIAGLEPVEFTNIFPIWENNSELTSNRVKEGRWTERIFYNARSVLNELLKERYSMEELKRVPLPDGVDPLRLEHYLSDEEFELSLGIDRKSFSSLQPWKQLDLKKKANLF